MVLQSAAQTSLCNLIFLLVMVLLHFVSKQDIHNNENSGLISILNNYFAVLDAGSIKSIPDMNILLKRLSPKKLSCSVKIITNKSIY